ncbi:hypothetical protein B0T22DRAFT_77607 [Podospora appendiculata]|uniref:Uncharacterized protein n=1 Tax=Podospora appendiculata TaxID=314037 RepID=A0AAE0XK74_9PEZI|nr:hypothetical protein B0T22DRAFT_77607 [Podospora appendiculata]
MKAFTPLAGPFQMASWTRQRQGFSLHNLATTMKHGTWKETEPLSMSCVVHAARYGPVAQSQGDVTNRQSHYRAIASTVILLLLGGKVRRATEPLTSHRANPPTGQTMQSPGSVSEVWRSGDWQGRQDCKPKETWVADLSVGFHQDGAALPSRLQNRDTDRPASSCHLGCHLGGIVTVSQASRRPSRSTSSLAAMLIISVGWCKISMQTAVCSTLHCILAPHQCLGMYLT